MKYALVINDEIVEYRNYEIAPESKVRGGKPLLRPVVVVSAEYDADIQYKTIEVTIENTQIKHTEVVYDLPLADIKAKYITYVDSLSEKERLKYITDGAGQAMAYQQKYTEAVAFLADVSPTEEKYPHIYAESGITGDTPTNTAQVMVAMHGMWQTISANIERVRLTAKKAIADATTVQDVKQAAQINFSE